MRLFDTTSFRLTQEGLDALWLKQQVIAHNVSNADTPGYKAKYVNFAGVLRESTENLREGQAAKRRLHIEATVVTDASTNQLQDESNVDVDQQNTEFKRAQLQYQTLMEKMNSELTLIRTAIK